MLLVNHVNCFYGLLSTLNLQIEFNWQILGLESWVSKNNIPWENFFWLYSPWFQPWWLLDLPMLVKMKSITIAVEICMIGNCFKFLLRHDLIFFNTLYLRVVRFEYLYYEGYWMYPYNMLRNHGPSFHYTEKDFCK